MVYSTCTFSEEEDEWQIDAFLKNHPEITLLKVEKLLPHKVKGEGHFCALMQKNGNRTASYKKLAPPTFKDNKLLAEYLRFENDALTATVVSSTRSGGELLVRLRVDSSVDMVLYTRTCQGMIGDSVSTLMVPSRALYTYDNMVGVVVLDGSNQLFIPVNVLLEDGDNVYITAIQQGFLAEGMTVVLF